VSGAVAIAERVGRALAQLDATEDDDVAWFAAAVRTWLDGAPWDAALGLASGWREVTSHQRRQRALEGLLATLPGLRCAAAAREIAGALRTYETGEWAADRRAGHRPDGRRGLAFDYLAAGGPTSEERLRKILPIWSPKRVP
jgi:hypothetical protein